MEDILISIKPRFVKRIISGEKRVEIRRRRMHIAKGDRLWIYSTGPSLRIEAVATVASIAYGGVQEIWPSVSDLADISFEEYERYLAGSNSVCVIYLEEVETLSFPLSLVKIREKAPGFHPPQFFHRIPEDSLLLEVLLKANNNA
jgi:predicted transcriptional regulator